MNKRKILEILLTALISAGIAFLQNLLSQVGSEPLFQTNPQSAGIIGASISALRNFKFLG